MSVRSQEVFGKFNAATDRLLQLTDSSTSEEIQKEQMIWIQQLEDFCAAVGEMNLETVIKAVDNLKKYVCFAVAK